MTNEGPKQQPIKAAKLGLLVGIFKIKEPRLVSLWHDKLFTKHRDLLR